MRLGWVLLVGCSRPAPPPVLEGTAQPVEVEGCDVVRWQERAFAPMRARIAGREVTIVRERGDRTQVVAEVGRGVLLGGEVADGRFDRVVVRETAVVAAPRGGPVPGVFVEAGTAVEPQDGWARVEINVPIAVTGYVPRDATAQRWERGPRVEDAAIQLPASADVFASTNATAQPIARIAGDYRVVDRVLDAGGGWIAIDAHDTSVRIAGFIQPPHRSPLLGTYDFSDDTIEGELVRPNSAPEVAPGCLYARPDEHAVVVGVSDGGLRGRAAGNGWTEVRIAAPWGRVVGYGRVAPSSER